MSSDSERPPGGLPEDTDEDRDDPARDPNPHHVLNNPVGTPDPTEWPDPYDHREDPRAPEDRDPFGEVPHTPTGSESTSEPNPKQDPEAEPWARPPERDKLDE